MDSPTAAVTNNNINGGSSDSIQWILDSAATRHCVCDMHLLHNITTLSQPAHINTCNGVAQYTITGDVHITINNHKYLLHDVVYINNNNKNKFNVLSLNKILKQYNEISFSANMAVIKNNNNVMFTVPKVGDLYILTTHNTRITHAQHDAPQKNNTNNKTSVKKNNNFNFNNNNFIRHNNSSRPAAPVTRVNDLNSVAATTPATPAATSTPIYTTGAAPAARQASTQGVIQAVTQAAIQAATAPTTATRTQWRSKIFTTGVNAPSCIGTHNHNNRNTHTRTAYSSINNPNNNSYQWKYQLDPYIRVL